MWNFLVVFSQQNIDFLNGKVGLLVIYFLGVNKKFEGELQEQLIKTNSRHRNNATI
jgi:hypothetical protein